MRSLRSRLWLLWSLALLTSVGVGLLLVQLYRSSSTAQVERGEAVVARACDMIRDRYTFYVSGWMPNEAAPEASYGPALVPVVAAALRNDAGVAGGIWSATSGLLAASNAAGADMDVIQAANQDAAAADQSVQHQVTVDDTLLLVAACPLGGPFGGLTAWAMLRVRETPGFDSLRAGLALLGGLVLAIAAWVTWLTADWGRQVRQIEAALAAHDIEDLPALPATGERELDRIVAALNEAGGRLARARAHSAAMAAQVAGSERLAALGRVAAGVAHEIRNPMAAMRLRAENALAGDPARQGPALAASLVQIARVDRLVAELLAMTQRRQPELRTVALHGFLEGQAAGHRERADQAGVTLTVVCEETAASFDPELIGRALDNLLLNAIRHTPAGGHVQVHATKLPPHGLRIGVTDSGTGIDPALRPRLFEPFATSRPDGTGLGLAIAREMAVAHGGRLDLVEADGHGASFALDLPGAMPC